MAIPMARLFRRRVVFWGIVFLAVGLLSWFTWRCCYYVQQGRIIAAIEKQGGDVVEGFSESVFSSVTRFLFEPRYVALSGHLGGPLPDMTLASRLPGIYRLALYDAVIREEDAEAISRMTRVWCLSMTRVKASESLWPSLTHLPKLAWLFFDRVTVPDEGIADISRIRSLTCLGFLNCDIPDEGLARLCDLPKLEELYLSKSHLSVLGLQALRRLPGLECLDLAHCNLCDESMEALAGCTSLSRLNLSDNPITDRGLEILSRTPRSLSIELNNTKITDAGLQVFAQQTNKGYCLHLKGTAVTEAGVRKLLAANPLMDIHGVPSDDLGPSSSNVLERDSATEKVEKETPHHESDLQSQ